MTTSPSGGEPEVSLTEINKKLTNPVSDLWSIAFQQNNYMLDTGADQPHHWNSNLNFQPVLPVALTSNWNLITRPVVTLFNSYHTRPRKSCRYRTDDRIWGHGFNGAGLGEPEARRELVLGLAPRLSSPRPLLTTQARGSGRWALQPSLATSRRNGSLAAFFRTGHLLAVLEIVRTRTR